MTPALPDQLISALRSARYLAVLTGAGISAESGVPTFRDAQTGLWSRYDPTELATAQAFQSNPKLVWDWYQWRRDLVAKAAPNAGHLALAQLESRFSQPGTRFTLITQNVDGLHQQAGGRDVIELHGNLWRTKCFTEDRVVEAWPPTDEAPPRCPRCGGLLRPDVVWFGEALPRAGLAKATQASRTCDFFLSIGTSALVQPAASLPLIALEQGAVVVEINTDETPLTAQVTYSLRGAAGTILPELV
jgi:NAD-dependent protein deacetylase/lipoamidase